MLVASAVLGVCVIPLVLSGCVSAQEQRAAVDRFAERLEELPFVRSTTVSSNEALPWSVTAGVMIDLEPGTDRTALDELHDLACSIDVAPSPSLTLNYLFASGATLTQDGLGQCWTAPVAFVETIPALTVHESEIDRLQWKERADDDGKTLDVTIGLNEPSTVAGSMVVAGDLLAALGDDGTLVSLSSRGIGMPQGSLDDAKSYVAIVADLAAKYPLLRVTVQDDGLFVELETDAPGVTDDVRTYLAETYPALAIRAVADSADAVDGPVPSQEMLDSADIVRESGLAQAVTVGASLLSVTTATTAANAEIAQLLEPRGDVRVKYSTQLVDGPILYADSASRTALIQSQLEDSEVIVNALTTLGTVDSVHYTPAHLKVYLADDVYDDKASIEEAEKALRLVVESSKMVGTFRFVELNNRNLE